MTSLHCKGPDQSVYPSQRYATLAERAGVFQAPQTMLPPSQLMAINAVNAVDLDMSCFLPSCPMWQQLAKRCNDTVVSRLPSQMSSAVALTKFLSD